jgi:hypothetical protein
MDATCGSLKENPLVKLGIIPNDLQHILVSPPAVPTKRRRKKMEVRLIISGVEYNNMNKDSIKPVEPARPEPNRDTCRYMCRPYTFYNCICRRGTKHPT